MESGAVPSGTPRLPRLDQAAVATTPVSQLQAERDTLMKMRKSARSRTTDVAADDEDEELVVLRSKLDSAKKDLAQQRKEEEKKRLREELERTEKELREFKGKGEIDIEKKTVSNFDLKDLRKIKDLNEKVEKQLGTLDLTSDCNPDTDSDDVLPKAKSKPNKKSGTGSGKALR